MSFRVLRFGGLGAGHPLSVLGFWILTKSGLVSWAHLDTAKLIRYLQRIEVGINMLFLAWPLLECMVHAMMIRA